MMKVTKYLLLITSISVLLNACDKNVSEPKEQIKPVRAIKITDTIQDQRYNFSGIVQSSKESTLSFRVAGTVTDIPVTLGSPVKKSTVIAKLDSSDYDINYSEALAQEKNSQASMQSAKAQIRSAESEFIRNKATYQRAEQLYETNSIPLSEFEQARAAWQAAQASYDSSQLQFEAAQAQYASTRQQVQSSKNQLSYTHLRAPFSGIISQILVDENEQVASGAGIVVLSAKSKAEIEVGIPANIISSIKKGDSINAQFFSLNYKKYPGVITEVGFSSGESPVYPVIVQLNELYEEIRPGMSADVEFNINANADNQEKTAIIIPITSVGEDTKGKYVYILKPNKTDAKQAIKTFTIQRQSVEIGTLNSQGFEILSGLTTGQYIATAGLNILQQGDVVKLY